jgi:hypothetical protein
MCRHRLAAKAFVRPDVLLRMRVSACLRQRGPLLLVLLCQEIHVCGWLSLGRGGSLKKLPDVAGEVAFEEPELSAARATRARLPPILGDVRFTRVLVLLLAAVAALPAAARAGTVPLPGPPSFGGAGPLLSGDDAVWVTAGDGPLQVRSSGPDGPVRTVFSLDTPPNHMRFVEAFAVSSRRIAVVHRLGEPAQSGYTSTQPNQLLVGTRDGDLRPLGEPDRGCNPVGVGADGDVLVVTRMNCPGNEIVIHDLAAGGAPQPLPWRTGPGSHLDYDADVRIAGRFVAWHVRGDQPDPFTPIPSRLVVFDRAVGRVAYELRLDQYMGRAPVNFELNFDLQDDGTVVAAVPDYDASSSEPRRTLLWASLADPAPHVVPVGGADLQFGLHGGLLALRRAAERDYAVVDLQGRAVNVFDYHGGYGGGIDFDGRRLAWIQDGALHNEAFPVLAAPQLPPAGTLPVGPGGAVDVPVWCPQSALPCKVSVDLTPTLPVPGARAAASTPRRASGPSQRRRVTLPPRRTTTVRLRLSRAARRRAARRGGLRARALVQGRGTRARAVGVVLRTRRR